MQMENTYEVYKITELKASYLHTQSFVHGTKISLAKLQEIAEEDRQSAIRAENCRAARSQLSTLESGQRVARTNDKGEREMLDDKGRADETRRAREVIASDCR
jgi:hypothetical protein